MSRTLFPTWLSPKPKSVSSKAAASREFFWGVATSSDQHEGGINGENQPKNNWAWAEQSHQVFPIGESADFWHKAEADFERCRSLGLNAFRLSLSWPRIQPVTVLGAPETMQTPPPFDESALKRYAEILAACRRAGMEPIVTLQHFTHPAWLGLDAWLNPETIDHYLRYVEWTISYLLDALPRDHGVAPPKFFITINEPCMLASCHYLNGIFPNGGKRGPRQTFLCMANLLEAHTRAYRLLHRLYKERALPAPMVTFNNYCSDLYWNDQGWLDLLFAHARGIPRERILPYLWEEAGKLDKAFREARLPIHPWLRRWSGELLKKLHHVIVSFCLFDGAWSRLLDLIYETPQAPFDYIAIDYYDPFIAHALRWPRWQDSIPQALPKRRPLQERFLDSITNKWWDWRLLPEGLGFFVQILDRFDLPILIAENGMANRSDPHQDHGRRDNLLRSDYLRQNIAMVKKLHNEGWPLIGYLHWSLVDNYEWGSYWPRFGLYTLDRKAVDFRCDNASATYAEEVARARQEFLNHI